MAITKQRFLEIYVASWEFSRVICSLRPPISRHGFLLPFTALSTRIQRGEALMNCLEAFVGEIKMVAPGPV